MTTPRWTEPLRDAFCVGEIGWKAERITHGEEKGAIVWIARRVTPALAERGPELRVRRWGLIEVDETRTPVHADAWAVEPGRLGPPREPDEDVPIPW